MKEIILSKKDLERFWSKVGQKELDECWYWNPNNLVPNKKEEYPKFWTKRGEYRVGHIMLYLDNRPITQKKPFALHHCDNKKCINPKHLYPGDAKDNMKDHFKRTGVYTYGERNGQAKVTDRQFEQILRMDKERIEYIHPLKEEFIKLRNNGLSQRLIAEKYNMSQQNVSKIIRGQYKKFTRKYTRDELGKTVNITGHYINQVANGRRRNKKQNLKYIDHTTNVCEA